MFIFKTTIFLTPDESQHTLNPTNYSEEDTNVVVQSKRKTIQIQHSSAEIRMQLMTLDKLISIAVRGGASDLLLKVGQLPMFRYNGDLYPLRDGARIDRTMIEAMAATSFSAEQLKKLEDLEDVDASYQSSAGCRVRVNIFHQRGELGMIIRIIPNEILSIDDLGMSPMLKTIAEYKRGLILLTGGTGSGKSTTLAAMIDHINRNKTSHIITIEDPIEFVHMDRKSMINQREIGVDVKSFAQGLRSALRQNPDVILVGELRDTETIEVALQAAETGHLVLSTMHTNDAADTMVRIMSALGPEKETTVRTQIAESLRAVISQRLLRRKDKQKRVAAQEILVNTATIREKILKGANPSIVREFIGQGQNYGMQTFDQHIFYLFSKGLIDYEEAITNATSRDDFALRASGVSTDQTEFCT